MCKVTLKIWNNIDSSKASDMFSLQNPSQEPIKICISNVDQYCMKTVNYWYLKSIQI